MSLAAYNTLIQVSGTSTSMTTESTTLSGGNTVAQITSTSKRVIDPATAISLYDNGVLQAASTYTVNYMFGKFTKTSTSWTGPVTITANYLPLLTVGEARAVSINCSRTMLNASAFSSTITAERFIAGLRKASGSFETQDTPFVDWDGVGGAPVHDPFGIFQAGTNKLISVQFGGTSGDMFRSWVLFTGLGDSAEVDGVYKRVINWQQTSIVDSNMDADSQASFAWSFE